MALEATVTAVLDADVTYVLEGKQLTITKGSTALRDQGVLSAHEFAAQKSKLITWVARDGPRARWVTSAPSRCLAGVEM